MPNTFVRFDQSFETDSEGYFIGPTDWSGAITLVASGTGGIASPDGTSHAIFEQTDDAGGLTGPFTRFDGYRALDTNQSVTTTIKIYLDPTMAAGEGFDYSVAANGQDGNHLRDFIFHVTSDTSTGKLLIGASNNTNFDPREDLETINNAEITSAGWYTFEHVFAENISDGSLSVTLRVRDDTGSVVFTEVLNDPGDDYATEFGGNRYGWFTNIDVTGGILVDDAQVLTEDTNPVQVFEGSNIVASFATVADARTALDNGDITPATAFIKTTGLDDGFYYVADGMSIQAAVDAADAGDLIEIGAGTFNESVSIDKALDIDGAGVGQTIITAPSGSGFDISGDLGTSATLSIDGIEFKDAANGSGIEFDDAAILGTLEITNSEFEGNFRNGVAIGANGSPVDLDNVIISDTDFIGNGGDPASQTSSGDGDLLFFQYYGNATLTNINITGVSVGSGPAENAIQFRGDAGALGNVVLTNVAIDGVYEKQPIAFFNYDDVLGLSSSNVSITADSTGFQISGNFDGIGGDIDFANQDIDTSGAPDPIALQGNGDSQLISSGAEDAILRGAGGNDTLNGGGGDDLAAYAGTSSDFSVGVTTDANGFVTGFTSVTDNNPGDGDEGADLLTGIEAISFAGNGVVLDLSQNIQLFDETDQLVGTFDTLKEAVDAASNDYTVLLGAGLHDQDTAQIVIDVDLTIVGAGKDQTTFEAAFDTSSSGDARGWFLVEDGVNLDVEGITFDGGGHLIWQAFRHKGSGDFNNVAFTDIGFQESGPSYAGTAIAVFGATSDVDVTNSMFSDIGRVGVLYFGSGVSGSFSNNTYTGKGDGDFLDYALDISAGASIVVNNNSVTGNRGVASSDGSGSAAFLVSTFFGGGTNAVFSGNTMTDNSTGVFIGFDSTDTSSVGFGLDNVASGGIGVAVRGNATVTNTNFVDGTFDWIGGDGANLISGASLNDTLQGNEDNDTIIGSDGIDVLEGDDGNDVLDGGQESDSLRGGDGDDTLLGRNGDDWLRGSAGNDSIDGADGQDDIDGGSGEDELFGRTTGDLISGGGDNDFVSGQNGDDTLSGDGGDDLVRGGGGEDDLSGGNGLDTLEGGNDNDTLDGGSNNDVLDGGKGNDMMNGGDGDDSIDGRNGDDIVDGGNGGDTISGDSGNDLIFGRGGDDSLAGNALGDSLRGGSGNDTLRGGDGSDDLDGGSNNDLLFGSNGNDTLIGGGGDDTLVGEGGNDTFVFEIGKGNDQINDLESGPGTADVIQLIGFGAAFDEFSEVIGAATEVGGDVVIDFGGGDTLTLVGRTIAQLDANDFVFG